MSKHLFRYRDVLRIVRVVEPSNVLLKPDLFAIFGTILAAEKDLLTDLARRGVVLFQETGSVSFILDQTAWLIQLLAGAPASVLGTVVQLLTTAFGFGPAPSTPPPVSPAEPPEEGET